jgi:hypothetical protein
MGFKFKFELFFNIPFKPFSTCKGTLKFWIQVSQSKFTVLKIMPRKIFGEFMKFFLKGLNPFKFQTKFENILLPKFLIHIVLRIWTSSQKESCSFWIYLWLSQAWKFLDKWSYSFCNLQVQSSWNIGKDLGNQLNGPDPLRQSGSTSNLAQPTDQIPFNVCTLICLEQRQHHPPLLGSRPHRP